VIRRRVLVPVVVVLGLLVLALAVSVISGGQSSRTNSTRSTSTATCPTTLPGPNTASNVTQIQGKVGTANLIDAGVLLKGGAAPVQYSWSQVMSSPTELDYVSGYTASIANASLRVASVVLPVPGNYRFQLRAAYGNGTSKNFLIDMMATEGGLSKLQVKGAIFADVFENLGGPHFTLGPFPTACENMKLDGAMAGPVRVGAGWAGFVPAIFYSQVSPVPKFQFSNDDLSLSNETYYDQIIASAKAHGLKVVQMDQVSVGPNTPQDQANQLPMMHNSSAWWDAWFTQWENITLIEAQRAQRAGVDMFALCLYCEDSFQPSVYPQYTDRWNKIISDVRQEFSGKVAMSLIVVDNRFTMASSLDAALVTIFPGQYITSGAFKDPHNPTMAELEKETRTLFGYFSGLAGKIAVYVVFLAYSSDGQYTADPPPWGDNPPPANLTDFREQSIYYEAFFNVVRNTTWINGVFTERWDYFDHLARLGDAPSSYYFDQTISDSPRNKPAEAVIKLWFGLL
jgi:hypothetical protein